MKQAWAAPWVLTARALLSQGCCSASSQAHPGGQGSETRGCWARLPWRLQGAPPASSASVGPRRPSNLCHRCHRALHDL